MSDTLTSRLSRRLAQLRAERGLTLDQLASASGVSRAALSRLEKAEVSPTAEVLGKLCTAYGLTMSRLLAMVEDSVTPLVPRDAQAVWQDAGFTRRMVSPGSASLRAPCGGPESRALNGCDARPAPPSHRARPFR